MLFLRSLIFNVVFLSVTALFVIIGSPLLFGPRSWAMAGLKAHALTTLWLMRFMVGITMELRGQEHCPKGAFIAASKHQSAWDTFALVPLFADPAMVMKAELFHIPFYGWFSRKFEMISVARAKRAKALKDLIKQARHRAGQGRQIVIFPEGTRKAPGAAPDYKTGIIPIYEALDVPCLPIALNSGLYWPRRKFMRYPGTIIVEFLPPIKPGLPRKEFMARLEADIEAATQHLILEAADGPNPPPLAVEMGNKRARD